MIYCITVTLPYERSETESLRFENNATSSHISECRLASFFILHLLSVLNHHIDCSDTGNGGLAGGKKQTTAAYRWSPRTPDVKTSRDAAPATASGSESFQSGMVLGRNECLR